MNFEEVVRSLGWSNPRQLSVQDLILICQRCRKVKNLAYAKSLHMHIREKGLENQGGLGNYVVPMFVDCDSITDAQKVFNLLVHRNEFSWCSLLKGYFNQGELQNVIKLFDDMQNDGILHNRHTLITPLKACAKLKSVEKGRVVHNTIYQQGLENDIVLGNTLVDMYAKCGDLLDAIEVFEKLCGRDTISWNALMAGYVEHGFTEEALKLLDQMNRESVAFDKVTILCGLKASGNGSAIETGQDLHSVVVMQGLDGDLFLGNALVDMYVKCGFTVEARHVLDEMPTRDVISWTSIISGYVDNGYGEEALNCLNEMQNDGVSPNAATFVCSLKACSCVQAIDTGREIHRKIPLDLYKRDPSIGNSLVDMYAKCGTLKEAEQVFINLPVRNIVSWNALIAGLTDRGLGDDALDYFDKMQLESISPDSSSLNCSLKASGIVGSLDRSQEIHAITIKKGLEKANYISNTLVDVYAKSGLLEEAQQIFDQLKIRNVVSWTALIVGYAEHGLSKEALNCLDQMQQEGISPNPVTSACSLKACADTGNIRRGQEIHAEVTKRGDLCLDIEDDIEDRSQQLSRVDVNKLRLGNALIDMYAKSGNVFDAQNVFDAMSTHDLVSWNALITGYSRQGFGEAVFVLFECMKEEGVVPDGITFLSLLSVCCHAGLVKKARNYFDTMSSEYQVSPTVEHYNCMVDLLGRAGQLKEAISMLQEMPFQPSIIVWSSILGSCRKWHNVEVAEHAFEVVKRLDKDHIAAFILMFNIYLDACMWEQAKTIEAMIEELKVSSSSRTSDLNQIQLQFDECYIQN